LRSAAVIATTAVTTALIAVTIIAAALIAAAGLSLLGRRFLRRPVALGGGAGMTARRGIQVRSSGTSDHQRHHGKTHHQMFHFNLLL
jgi:hypothetical protein